MTEGFTVRWTIKMPARPSFCLDRRSKNARRILSSLDADFVEDPRRANLLWLRRGVMEILPILAKGQLINHFAEEGAMINKGRLTANINAVGGRDFYPESYRLYDPSERDAFFEQLPGEGDPEEIWILKPADLSKGIGIRVLRQFDGLRRQFLEQDLSDPVVDPDLDYIAQRYLAEPLLLDGKKSELRIYWLIASLDPLRVLMFDEGTVRLTSQPYSLEDMDNPLVHITNSYQQKKHGNLQDTAALKWTFAKLQEYLTDDLGIAAPDFIDSQLLPRIRDCLSQIVEAVVDELRHTKTAASCFGLYGADVILDASLKPWITEIQKNPGLDHDNPVKAQIVPAMLREAVQIALATESGDWQDLPNRFEWIVGSPN